MELLGLLHFFNDVVKHVDRWVSGKGLNAASSVVRDRT
jgi:hypothetical protein